MTFPSNNKQTFIEIFFQEGDPAFICGANGHITTWMLDKIEKGLDDEYKELFDKGNGRYLFETIGEPEAYFDLNLVDFESIEPPPEINEPDYHNYIWNETQE